MSKSVLTSVYAPMTGRVIPLSEVPDPVFSDKILGDGIAIIPSDGNIYSPVTGTLVTIAESRHAFGFHTAEGAELLLHVGIDTVKLGGQHFTAHVANDQQVKKGDLLLSFDMEAIKAAGYLCTTPMIVCNTDEYQSVTPIATGKVKPGQAVLEVKG